MKKVEALQDSACAALAAVDGRLLSEEEQEKEEKEGTPGNRAHAAAFSNGLASRSTRNPVCKSQGRRQRPLELEEQQAQSGQQDGMGGTAEPRCRRQGDCRRLAPAKGLLLPCKGLRLSSQECRQRRSMPLLARRGRRAPRALSAQEYPDARSAARARYAHGARDLERLHGRGGRGQRYGS